MGFGVIGLGFRDYEAWGSRIWDVRFRCVGIGVKDFRFWFYRPWAQGPTGKDASIKFGYLGLV